MSELPGGLGVGQSRQIGPTALRVCELGLSPPLPVRDPATHEGRTCVAGCRTLPFPVMPKFGPWLASNTKG